MGLKSLNDPIDTTTSQGRLILNLFASLAIDQTRAMATSLPFVPGGSLHCTVGRLAEEVKEAPRESGAGLTSPRLSTATSWSYAISN